MEANATIRRKADYGVDAPKVVRNLIAGGVAALVVGVGLSLVLGPSQQVLADVVGTFGFFASVGCLVTAVLMVLSSKLGKFRERDRLLDSIAWRGDETILDVGCGRGLLLIGAAKRLTTGRAVGVDIWQSEDQSGNYPEVTAQNASVEGVADRVEIKYADARWLPFGDEGFDVVVSSLALHNIRDAQGREQAIKEIARVLKPGGRVALLDIARTAQYERVLRETGMEEVERSGLRFFVFPAVRLVRGTKPPAPGSAELEA